jgi:hypothetical protein
MHSDRVRMERMLADNKSQAFVAKTFEVSPDAVQRHWRSHISEDRKAALKLGEVPKQELVARVAEESARVVDYYHELRADLRSDYLALRAAGDYMTAASVAGRLLSCLNSMAKISGELANSPLVKNSVNVFVMPEWSAIEHMLLEVLSPHPEILTRVVQALEALEARRAPRADAALPAPIEGVANAS